MILRAQIKLRIALSIAESQYLGLQIATYGLSTWKDATIRFFDTEHAESKAANILARSHTDTPDLMGRVAGEAASFDNALTSEGRHLG